MRKLIVVVVMALIAFVGAVTAPRAEAQGTNYPTVSNLTPFSPDANFMSLPGYLRYLVLTQNGTWISHDQAVQVVDQQKGK